jgi:hypothetical protein
MNSRGSTLLKSQLAKSLNARNLVQNINEFLNSTQFESKKPELYDAPDLGDVKINGKPLRDYGDTYTGSLDVNHVILNSLKGCPKRIIGNFFCDSTRITSLEGGPLYVTGDFNCSNTKITTLKGGPIEVGGTYSCVNTPLTSLEGCVKQVNDSFRCFSTPKLKSLRYAPIFIKGDLGVTKSGLETFDCPDTYIDGNLYISNCESFKSFDGFPKSVNEVNMTTCNIKNLHNIHKYVKSIKAFWLSSNPIESHVLGLLKINDLESVQLDNKDVEAIINEYLPLGDIFECQSKLIEAGYEEYAQL